jgi:membrane-bound metal-dependent hydrolase YbcI (DUF457 family)
MMYYDHALVAAAIAVGVGAQRRFGWPVVVMAALAGMSPDWDATPKHVSQHAYLIAHRVWGHNLFAATFVGASVGAVAYLVCRPKPGASRRGDLAVWVVLGTLIAWSHPLLDVLYCGIDRNADWPVALLWPVVSARVGVPWIPWSDWGATGILAAGMLLVLLLPRHRQLAACCTLLTLGLYVAIRGGLLHA